MTLACIFEHCSLLTKKGIEMKRSFKLENLDCANCAAKMENAINGLEGVSKATVSFMTQKLVLDAPDDQFEALLEQAQEAIARIEPDCKVVRR